MDKIQCCHSQTGLNSSVDYLTIWYLVLTYLEEHPGILGTL